MNKKNKNNSKVYIHVSPSGKMYVGQTCQEPKKRWNYGNGYRGQAFYNAIKKYGWHNFKSYIVKDNLSMEEANNLEELLIKYLRTRDNRFGYNVKHGGNVHELDNRTKHKISIKNSKKVYQFDLDGNFIAEYESCHKAGDALGGSFQSISACAQGKSRKSNTYNGYIFSYSKEKEEIDRRVALLNDNRKYTKIDQYTLYGEYVKTYNSIKEIDGGYHGISSCCKGETSSYKNYVWRYHGEDFDKYEMKTIVQIDKNTYKIVGIYGDARTASSETGINYQNIRDAVCKRRKSAGGFIWSFYHECRDIAV